MRAMAVLDLSYRFPFDVSVVDDHTAYGHVVVLSHAVESFIRVGAAAVRAYRGD